MPQLEVGHRARLATIRSALTRDLPGVVVAGAPYHGPGLSSCLRSAVQAATSLATTLEESHA
jgi:protoporphyrinogen/coproporphyrinogen III oxidase